MNVAPPSWIQTMLNSIDSFCHQLAYKNISVMFFFFCCCFFEQTFCQVLIWKHYIFRFWFSVNANKKRPPALCGSATPKTARPVKPLLSWQHFACACMWGFLSVCACICCILGEWQAQLFVVIWCMTRFTHAHTHTHAGQSTKQKALWERLGWHICVCVCLRMETVNMKCVCVCTLGRRGSPWHSRNKIRPSNTLNYKTSLWKKRKNVFNFH